MVYLNALVLFFIIGIFILIIRQLLYSQLKSKSKDGFLFSLRSGPGRIPFINLRGIFLQEKDILKYPAQIQKKLRTIRVLDRLNLLVYLILLGLFVKVLFFR